MGLGGIQLGREFALLLGRHRYMWQRFLGQRTHLAHRRLLAIALATPLLEGRLALLLLGEGWCTDVVDLSGQLCRTRLRLPPRDLLLCCLSLSSSKRCALPRIDGFQGGLCLPPGAASVCRLGGSGRGLGAPLDMIIPPDKRRRANRVALRRIEGAGQV
jgi:hypothetical protein